MMHSRPLSAPLALLISALLPLALAGCRKPAPAPVLTEAEIESQQINAAGAHPPAFYNTSSEDALLTQHTVQGLELALRMDAPSYASGTPIPFHILIRDRAATEPIAAGLCSGLSLAWQKLDDGSSDSAGIDNHRCFDTIPSPDETPLTKGEIKKVDITQIDASHASFSPGRYLVNLSWQPYAAGRGTIAGREPYATLKSNVILFTVTP